MMDAAGAETGMAVAFLDLNRTLRCLWEFIIHVLECALVLETLLVQCFSFGFQSLNFTGKII